MPCTMNAAEGTVGAGGARLVLTTAPDVTTARRLARGLVEARIAACANLVEGVSSIYRWKEAVEEQAEVLLFVKTTEERLGELSLHLARHHPYELPELVVLEPAALGPAYLAWLKESCGAQVG